MTDDLEPVMLSMLQHYLFCPRQCALIHIEGVWRENYLTTSGSILHDRVDRVGSETRRDVHLATALRLESVRLGLYGVADMVEFHRKDSPCDEQGKALAAKLHGRPGWWQPVPIEYKRGRPKQHRADEVQLCAQAICLEEMLDVSISEGCLFYGETHQRTVVLFDESLRNLTADTVRKVRAMLDEGRTPPANEHDGCASCSLYTLCAPRACGMSANKWLERQIDRAMGESLEETA